MAQGNEFDRSNLSFSQAEGLEPLPQPLRLGETSDEFRNLIWRELFDILRTTIYPVSKKMVGNWRDIFYDFHVERLHRPADEFSAAWSEQAQVIKHQIYETEWNKLFDFIQFILLHPQCPYGVYHRVNLAFLKSRAAYIVASDRRTIVPAATPEEGKAIKEALRVTAKTGFGGANEHLRLSAKALNDDDFAGSVRESIHAVESVARRLDVGASKTLGPALEALELKSAIHPALKAGFKSIYGYSSDEKGVRHALLEGKSNVDQEDALFMIGACASFVSYLINKAQKSGLLNE